MIQLILAMLFVFFLPGLFLVNMIFPRRGELDLEYDTLYRLTLGVVMSIVTTVLLGFALNSLGTDPGTGLGYVTGTNLWIGLGAISLLFFLGGWWRGAYPWLGRLHPSLLREAPPAPTSIASVSKENREALRALRELANERDRLRKEMKDAERRSKVLTGDRKQVYEKRRERARKELERVDKEIKRLEEERAEELY